VLSGEDIEAIISLNKTLNDKLRVHREVSALQKESGPSFEDASKKVVEVLSQEAFHLSQQKSIDGKVYDPKRTAVYTHTAFLNNETSTSNIMGFIGNLVDKTASSHSTEEIREKAASNQ
jgi:hypothetical protein